MINSSISEDLSDELPTIKDDDDDDDDDVCEVEESPRALRYDGIKVLGIPGIRGCCDSFRGFFDGFWVLLSVVEDVVGVWDLRRGGMFLFIIMTDSF